MKRIWLVIALAMAVVVGLKAAPVVAESVMMESEKLSVVAKDTTVDGSVYLVGESVDVQGTVQGDVYCAGQTVTISGTVDGDVLCAGQSVTVNGVVHGDVRVAGMNIMLKGQIDGGTTLAGMNITTDSASKIGRDATIAAGMVNLSGTITRDLMMTGGTMTLEGTIGRDAAVSADSVTATATAKIGGNLQYSSDNEAVLASGVVAGTVERTATPERPTVSISFADVILAMFLAVVAFSVLAVIVTLLAPRYVHQVSDIEGAKQFGMYFLIGLVGLVVTPIILLMMLVTVVGAYAAFVLGVAVLLATLVGGVLVAYRLGRFMMQGAKTQPFINALIGSLALGVLGMVPLVGVLVMLVSTATGFGMVIMGMKSQYEVVETVPKSKLVTKRPKRPRT